MLCALKLWGPLIFSTSQVEVGTLAMKGQDETLVGTIVFPPPKGRWVSRQQGSCDGTQRISQFGQSGDQDALATQENIQPASSLYTVVVRLVTIMFLDFL